MNEYRRGIKNSADLKVAADGLFEASLKREAFKFDFLNSRIDLERALGGKVEIETIQE
jgi:outer membrane protein TolC